MAGCKFKYQSKVLMQVKYDSPGQVKAPMIICLVSRYLSRSRITACCASSSWVMGVSEGVSMSSSSLTNDISIRAER